MKTNKITILTMVIITIGLLIGATQQTNTNNKVTVTNILHESTNDFYLEPNEIGIEFSNGSWAVVNEQTNTYIFQAVELGDYEQEFNNLQDFENCIKTYASIKNTGSY